MPAIIYFKFENSFSISCKASLMIMNCLSFCLSREDFMSPFLKASFSRYNILG